MEIDPFYSGKTVFITGASAGIGAALAHELAARGAKVVLGARRIDLVQKIADEIHARGGDALALRCDVTRREDLDQALETAKNRFSKVDIVIANAGMGINDPMAKLTTADY